MHRPQFLSMIICFICALLQQPLYAIKESVFQKIVEDELNNIFSGFQQGLQQLAAQQQEKHVLEALRMAWQIAEDNKPAKKNSKYYGKDISLNTGELLTFVGAAIIYGTSFGTLIMSDALSTKGLYSYSICIHSSVYLGTSISRKLNSNIMIKPRTILATLALSLAKDTWITHTESGKKFAQNNPFLTQQSSAALACIGVIADILSQGS